MKKISISNPEGVVTAKAGEEVLASDNSRWLKTTNTGNTGWVMLFDQNQIVQNIPTDIAIWATKTPPSGDVVGTTDTQTLENKTLESPEINSPTIESAVFTDGPIIDGDPTINGNTTINGDATISGNATIDGNTTIDGGVTINSGLAINAGGLAVVGDGFSVLGDANFNLSNITVNGSITVDNGGIGINGYGGLYVDADSTLNGSNNTAPNQTAASASSLMTRELSDARYLSFANLRVAQSSSVSVANSGTDSNASGNALQWYATGNPGTAANGYARMSVARGLNRLPTVTGTGINFSLPIGGAFLIFAGCYPAAPEKSFRIIFGGNASVPAPADSNALSTRGFGMEIKYESGSPKWRLFAHNGTTYTTSPNWQTFPGNPSSLDDFVACVIESDGAGTINARVGYAVGPNLDLRNATAHSISGGPTGIGDQNNSYVDLVVVNPSTGGPHYSQSRFIIISRPQFYF